MSLRTKLLAAIVGLNGAILLLALFLLLRSEPDNPTVPVRDLVADLVQIGAAVAAPPGKVSQLQTHLEMLEESGVVRQLFVVEEDPRGGSAKSRYRVWSVSQFLAGGGTERLLDAGSDRDSVERAFLKARQNPDRGVYLDDEMVAIVLPTDIGEGRRRGVVARHVPWPDQRSGIRLVYVVMVVGVILLTAVSFWLVSRLVVQPLAQLTEAADRIARGDYRVRVPERGTNDEFDRTTVAFNRMAGEIEEYQGHLEDRVLSALRRMQKAEQHLGIAQRLAATGKLASGVAHEINNPLGGMKNAVRSLARGDLDADQTVLYLDLIRDGLNRVEETVKKFLSFTPRRLEPRPTDLADVAHKAAEFARHRVERDGVQFEEDLPEVGEAVVFGDPHELQQVALNFLLNAADAVRRGSDGRVVIRVRRHAEEVSLEVQDNGVGLSPEDQDRCFDMFFTTKQVGEGTGLGLAVAHTIVTNHGGRIEVESTPGQGAIFRVVLPGEENWATTPDRVDGPSPAP